MIVIFAAQAEEDLEQIGDWLLDQSPHAAERVVTAIQQACNDIRHAPFTHPIPPAIEGLGLRRRICGRYLIFYKADGRRIEIARILHGARDYERILGAGD